MDFTMARGDSETLRVTFIDDNLDPIPLVIGDEIIMTAKADPESATEAFQISTTDGSITIDPLDDTVAIIEIEPEDTEALAAEFPGGTVYYYDIQLTQSGGRRTTIPRTSAGVFVHGEITLELDVTEP